MTRKLVIDRLSEELAFILKRNDEIDIIKQYMTMIMSIEQNKLKGKINIYHKIDKKTGIILNEYWGMDEIYTEFKGKYNTVRRLINGSISGEKRSAYGYYWKRL